MKLVELKCKNCGAKLSIPKDSKNVTCDFCKTTFQIDDEIKHIKYDNMMQSGYEFEKGRIQAQEEKKEKQIKEFINFCEQQTISNKQKKLRLSYVVSALLELMVYTNFM